MDGALDEEQSLAQLDEFFRSVIDAGQRATDGACECETLGCTRLVPLTPSEYRAAGGAVAHWDDGNPDRPVSVLLGAGHTPYA